MLPYKVLKFFDDVTSALVAVLLAVAGFLLRQTWLRRLP